ncbi:hypothetical protein APL41_gp19 [Lactobacillus phage LBR48]|uniref:Uncharacterized protein n=1 Tax=Lactobacillus phage LBR48 TaxID=755164 RepID=D6PST3_9CAUD|nr:hypothetical protein APL41_gp19 [Lactobacillus phage LBR48]ADF83424.1 hypothetical protein [Lactobacillus phage LBR48]
MKEYWESSLWWFCLPVPPITKLYQWSSSKEFEWVAK